MNFIMKIKVFQEETNAEFCIFFMNLGITDVGER